MKIRRKDIRLDCDPIRLAKKNDFWKWGIMIISAMTNLHRTHHISGNKSSTQKMPHWFLMKLIISYHEAVLINSINLCRYHRLCFPNEKAQSVVVIQQELIIHWNHRECFCEGKKADIMMINCAKPSSSKI